MGRSMLVAFVTSVVTSVATFAVLTLADQRGMLDAFHGRRPAANVPSISGLSVEQARELLRARDLLLTLEGRQPERAVAIPTLAGARPDDAVEQLRNRKLATGHRRDAPSDSIAAGLVVDSDPPAGRSVAPGTDVTLIISTGGAQKPVPKVVGFRLGRAKKTLEDAGFAVGTTRIGSSDSYDDDVIIKQDPVADALAAPHSAVNLVIND